MLTRIHPIGAVALGTLLLALPGCTCDCPPAPTPAAALVAAPSACENGDLGERSKLYNQPTLDAVRDAFTSHFKVQVDTVRMEVQTPAVKLSVDKLESLRAALKPTPVAIQVHYGLHGDAFFPVFQFMKLAGGGAYAEPMGGYYVAVNGELKPASQTSYLPTKLMGDYRENIRVLRTDASTTWDSVRTTGTDQPDPLAEWFRFDLELLKLFADNPGGEAREVVISCISEFVCYSSTVGMVSKQPEEEYRHMLAWHMVIDGKDELDEADLGEARPQGDNYFKRAVDLGHLCPPRCK